jgi:hypothetical protein
MLELSPKQIAVLEKIAARGFAIVAFPLYASAAGVRKGNCAALLAPIPHGGMQFLGDPCCLVNGNLSVRIRHNGVDLFVWKKQQLEATQYRLEELAQFRRELDGLLAAAS